MLTPLLNAYASVAEYTVVIEAEDIGEKYKEGYES